jgi:hypothetical protein
VVGREDEAHRFLANLIPEFLHVHGPEAAKWFTSQGITVYQHVRWNPKKGTTTSSKAKESAALVKEDLWDLSEQWKTLADKAVATTDSCPDETKLDAPNQAHYVDTQPTTESTILERLAGDKSIASFGQTFGRDDDSDDAKAAAVLAAETAAHPPLETTGAKFLFSPEQVTREREKADQDYESDGKSMSTAGKTTDSTRLNLKIALEQIAELQLELQRKKDHEDTMETDATPNKTETNKAVHMDIDESTHESSEDEEEIVFTPTAKYDTPQKVTFQSNTDQPDQDDPQDEIEEIFRASENHEDEGPTPYQLLGESLGAPPPETIQADSDAMEEDYHAPVYIGKLPPLPSSASSESNQDPSTASSSTSSSSSSSSSSSEGSHDTQELANKLKNNQYQALSNKKYSKKSTEIDDTSDSQDPAAHPSPGQDSGDAMTHLHAEPLDEASSTQVHAGLGD